MCTGKVSLKFYLHKIGAADLPLCRHCRATETVQHVLLACSRWTALRQEILWKDLDHRESNLTLLLSIPTLAAPSAILIIYTGLLP